MKRKYTGAEKGGMLLEMIAVLGLVAMSAPAIYKKNIERTEEIRDMTKASQLRVLKDAASQYIEKQYEGIIRDKASGSDWQKLNDGKTLMKKTALSISDLSSYLPAGYIADEGIKIYLTAKPDSSNANHPQGLISALVVDGEDITEKHGNRIARMIGVEGGFSVDGTLYGNRGVWSMKSQELNGVIPDNRVVVSSSYSKSLSSADYIYRNKVEGYPEANMMFTDIDMNDNSIEYIGRLAMRYNNGDKWATPTTVTSGDEHEGSNGGSERDKGISLLVHGERGEIVGKTRSQAKENEYNWWSKEIDKDGNIVTNPSSSTLNDKSHFKEKTTLEISVGGPTRGAEEQDGYLRLRAPGDNLGCTRIESNYNTPERGKMESGYTGGGAFIACANVQDSSSVLSSEDKNGGSLGMATASLVADDKSGGEEGGSGYMIVINPNNNRKAVMYGNYGTSFYNANREFYAGSALELISDEKNGHAVLAATVASELEADKSGASDKILTGFGKNKQNSHEESSVANLYSTVGQTEANDNLKVQLRADDKGGYLYLKDDDNADIPAITLSGSKNDDADRTYSVVTRNGDNGYAKMQAGYSENGTSDAGAFVVRNNASENGVDVAVLTDEKNGTEQRSGLFILKDKGYDRVRINAKDGGAVYMGNTDNSEILSGTASTNRTVAIESRNGSKSAGTITLSSGNNKSEAKVTSYAEKSGAGMHLKDAGGNENAILSASSTSDISNKTDGGVLRLKTATGDSGAKAELLTDFADNRNNSNSTHGGTLVLSDGSSKNIIVTARGPSSGGWVSVGKGTKRGVDVFADYLGRGAAVMISPNKEANNNNLHANKSVVEMLAGGTSKNKSSPVMNVHNADYTSKVSAIADITKSDSSLKDKAKGSSLSIFKDGIDNVALVSDANNGGWLKVGGSNIFAKTPEESASVDVGGVVIKSSSEGGNIEADNVNVSVRVKTAGTVTADTVYSLVTNASSYNGFDTNDHNNISGFIISAMSPHMGSDFATVETKIGHWRCIKKEKNCPVYAKNENGEYIYDQYGDKIVDHYDGADDDDIWGVYSDVKKGRKHDYSLYSYGEIDVKGVSHSHEYDARHVLQYDIGEFYPDYYNKTSLVTSSTTRVHGGETKDGNHELNNKWHDNRSVFDGGMWSNTDLLYKNTVEEGFPDQVMGTWNKDKENY